MMGTVWQDQPRGGVAGPISESVVMAEKPQSLYGERDPIDVPAYSLTDAAHHLRLPLFRVWALKGRWLAHGFDAAGLMAVFFPLVEEPARLSFRQLVEMHILSALLAPLPFEEPLRIDVALDELREKLAAEHPLSSPRLVEAGVDILVERLAAQMKSTPSRDELCRLLRLHRERVDFDGDRPLRLYPFTRERLEKSPRLVVIDPRLRFGAPTVAGRGVPTAILLERFGAGESVQELAEDYGMTAAEVEEAIRYEARPGDVAHEVIRAEASTCG
jgi:uncharacterized protein (DUF433 family)